MTLFLSSSLDLARLPTFKLVDIDHETEKAALLAGIKARFQARGIPYDVDMLETDTAVILAEEFAYRKTLTLGQINDAGKRFTLVSSYGATLDAIGATYYADIGVERLVVTPGDPVAGAPAVMEDDDRFRRRIQLAPEARTPGTLGGYEYWALTAAPRLTDARALNHASGLVSPGQILVVLLGGADEADQVVLAQTFLLSRNVKLATDMVVVRAATRLPATINAVLEMRPGPSPGLVQTEAETNLSAYLAKRRRIGERVTKSSIDAALTAGGVDRVRQTTPTTDIDPGPDGVVEITSKIVTTEIVGD
jgi:phage-related baseplate assembly protein